MSLSKLFTAILMNLLLLPGSGHAYLKHKKRGLLFSAATIVLLLVFTVHLSVIFSELLSGLQIDVDMFSLSQRLTRDLMEKWGVVLKLYVFVIGVIYIYSAVDVVLIYLNEKEKSLRVHSMGATFSREASEKGTSISSPDSLSKKPSRVSVTPNSRENNSKL